MLKFYLEHRHKLGTVDIMTILFIPLGLLFFGKACQEAIAPFIRRFDTCKTPRVKNNIKD
jgi:hypothetical protein